jgi:hypothetical protein
MVDDDGFHHVFLLLCCTHGRKGVCSELRIVDQSFPIGPDEYYLSRAICFHYQHVRDDIDI